MTFTIATFNTRDFFDDEAPHVIGELDRDEYTPKRREKAMRFFESKLETIARVMVQLDADIVSLQEVKGERVIDRLCETIGDRIRGYPVRALSEKLDPRGIRIALLSRFDLAGDIRQHGAEPDFACPLPEVAEGAGNIEGIRFRRGALEVPLRLPSGETLVVVGVHLKSNNPLYFTPMTSQGDHAAAMARSAMHRMAEALRLRRIVDERLGADPRALLAVVGDLNETEDSLVHRMICGSEVAATRHHLPPAVLKPCTALIPAEQRFSILFRGRRMLLDHVLASPSLHVRMIQGRILNEDLEANVRSSSSQYTFSPESDHAPVLCWFS